MMARLRPGKNLTRLLTPGLHVKRWLLLLMVGIVMVALAIMASVILTVLGAVNYHLTIIANERDSTALPLLRNGQFNFLITDWNMPGMPGLDLLKAVRAVAAGQSYLPEQVLAALQAQVPGPILSARE